jgi:beta-glucosidase
VTDLQPSRTPSESDLDERLRTLSLAQKVRLLTGADFWSLPTEPSIGLRRIVMSDGPAGVRGETWDERDPSANPPSATALAATWDVARVHRLGRLLAWECRRKGVDVLLAPTVNIQRSPYAGRHFEMFSEDPLLTALMGAAYVVGLQSEGVAATVKHFVANDSETDRYTANMVVDDRSLREIYLAPFELIVSEARAWAVMAAYNQTNGVTMTESPMLQGILRDEWAFDGVTVTDWFAGRSTVPTANSALDLIMPGPDGPWGAALTEAVRAGRVPPQAVDDKVLRLLRLARRVGALEGMDKVTPPSRWTDSGIAAELRSTAAASFVLLRNVVPSADADAAERPVLPLDVHRLGSVAVVGPNALAGRTLGGGAALVLPPYSISPLAGLRNAVGAGVRVEHAAGVRAHTRLSPAPAGQLRLPGGEGAGVQVDFLGDGGELLGSEHRPTSSFTWQGGFGDITMDRVAAIRVRTQVRVDRSDTYVIGGSGVGRFVLHVNGSRTFDIVLALPEGADPAEGMMRPPQHGHPVQLHAGETVDIELLHERTPSGAASFDAAMVSFQLNMEPPSDEDSVAIERAVTLASEADVAVVVVGTTEEVESEGFDRDSLSLPGQQDELVRRVASANPRTIVVVNSGSPVLLPWREDVPAILQAWFPGQEFGHALADVLLGAVEPGGRLPTTWPADEGAPLPSTRPVNGQVVYTESLHVGYRRFLTADVEPAYWFGHGLGYTTWAYTDLQLLPDGVGGADVLLTVTNTGSRPGHEVVQVYASKPSSSIDRPVRWLVGFATLDAAPGEPAAVVVSIRARAFEHWDTGKQSWVLEPGVFDLHVARSAVAIVASTSFDPSQASTARMPPAQP